MRSKVSRMIPSNQFWKLFGNFRYEAIEKKNIINFFNDKQFISYNKFRVKVIGISYIFWSTICIICPRIISLMIEKPSTILSASLIRYAY